MNNLQYFAQYKAACEMIFTSHDNDWLYLKNVEFKYQAMTKAMCELIGADLLTDLIDETLLDIRLKLNTYSIELVDKLQKQDSEIIKLQKRRIYLGIISQKTTSKIVVFCKTPIINPSNNEVVGVYGQISTLLWPSLIKTLFKMHGAKGLLLNAKRIHDPLVDYPLTNIQHMVLFLCIHNYSYSEISLLISEFGNKITPVQVNERLENLKLIFHVSTKSQLIEKAIGLNFHVQLPCDLFNNLDDIEISNDLSVVVCANCKRSNCSKHDVDFTTRKVIVSR